MKSYVPNYLKGKNRRLVFDLLREKGRMSRAEITRDTGISFPTVLKVADALLSKGILTELEETSPSVGAGRKARLLQFEPSSFYAIGVECEGRFTYVGLVDMAGNVHRREVLQLGDFLHTRDLSLLSACIREMCSSENLPVLGVCIGFPANIDPETGDIVSFSKMSIWKPVPFREVFPNFLEDLDLPVFLENDVNLACEGEAFLRKKETGVENMLFLSIGSGCGGAVRLDGELRRGARCRAGEVGAMLLDPDLGVPKPGQKRQTLEDTVCLETLERRFHISLSGQALSPDLSDTLCHALCAPLSGILYSLVMTLDVELCVLAGVLPEVLGPKLCNYVSSALREAIPDSTVVRVESSVSGNAGIIGAAVTVFDRSLDRLLGSE